MDTLISVINGVACMGMAYGILGTISNPIRLWGLYLGLMLFMINIQRAGNK